MIENQNPTPPPTRLIVLTDISSLTPGLREPDDGQSMVRLMLYSNEIEIEGLIASSNMGHGQTTRPELIHEVVQAYANVQPNLQQHDRRYPAGEQLAGVIRAGQPAAGPKIPVFDSIGAERDTPASEHILACLAREDARPLWVAVWGGTADLAQALWRLRHGYPPAEAARWLARLRIHAIGDQDSTGTWIKAEFPELFYITRSSGFRGMYRGGDRTLCSAEWLEKHVKGHGALGELYPIYEGGDIWSYTLGKVGGIKEGDTPSYLGMIPNGLNPQMEPAWGDWGGRCITRDTPLRWGDAADRYPGDEHDPAPAMSTVYRWRPDFQADFQARMDECLPPGAQAPNRPPRVQLVGGAVRSARSGETIRLDASGSSDPQGRPLAFDWRVYPEASSLTDLDWKSASDGEIFEFRLPPVSRPASLHVLLTVTNQGEPPLKRYGRTVITVLPQ